MTLKSNYYIVVELINLVYENLLFDSDNKVGLSRALAIENMIL